MSTLHTDLWLNQLTADLWPNQLTAEYIITKLRLEKNQDLFSAMYTCFVDRHGKEKYKDYTLITEEDDEIDINYVCINVFYRLKDLEIRNLNDRDHLLSLVPKEINLDLVSKLYEPVDEDLKYSQLDLDRKCYNLRKEIRRFTAITDQHKKNNSLCECIYLKERRINRIFRDGGLPYHKDCV